MSTKVNTVCAGYLFSASSTVVRRQLPVAELTRFSYGFGRSIGRYLITIPANSPETIRNATTVPSTRTAIERLPSSRGRISHPSAVAPGIASNCAAGPARTCHSNIAHANAVNSATAAQPTAPGPRRARQAAKMAPISPMIGSVASANPTRKLCL